MDIVFVLYLVNILFSLFLGFSVFQKYKNLGGVFFFVFTFLFSAWLFMYTVNYSSADPKIIIYTGRISYLLSLLSLSSFFLFILFFKKSKTKIFTPFLFGVLLIYAITAVIFIFTPAVISGVTYDVSIRDYYEEFGIGYPIFVILSVIAIILSVFFYHKTYKKLGFIDKIRFRYIVFSLLFFFVVGVFCLLILPIFGIRILEREIIIGYIPFLASGFYVLHRYYFFDFKIFFSNILSFIISWFSAFFGVFFVKQIQLGLSSSTIRDFWYIQKSWSFIDIFFGTVITFLIFNNIKNLLFKNYSLEVFKKKMLEFKKKIQYTTSIPQLTHFLERQSVNNLNIKMKLCIYDSNTSKSEIYDFFSSVFDTEAPFINDIVFIQENRHKFNQKVLSQELDIEYYLYFGVYSRGGKNIGYIAIGTKPLYDTYVLDEIEILKEFVHFVSYHVEYLNFYQSIQDMNFTLDKKVDEKTMQYNQLINKQREFIQVVSHELAQPITNSLVLLEADPGTKSLSDDIEAVYHEIKSAGHLLKTLFRVEQYDIQEVKLYKQKIDLRTYLLQEIETYKKTIKGFEYKIHEDLGYLNIDTIQFKEVLANLIQNAAKFSNTHAPRILMNVFKQRNFIYLTFEDNGEGIIGDEGDVFKKYYSKNAENGGLGLGLYLCKRIIELHGWEISTQKSQILGGAKFIIKISI